MTGQVDASDVFILEFPLYLILVHVHELVVLHKREPQVLVEFRENILLHTLLVFWDHKLSLILCDLLGYHTKDRVLFSLLRHLTEVLVCEILDYLDVGDVFDLRGYLMLLFVNIYGDFHSIDFGLQSAVVLEYSPNEQFGP